jgi:preprotein translocase subunit SecA
MNDQRKVVFEQRREMMAEESLEEMVNDMRHDVVEDVITRNAPPDTYPEAWNIEGLETSARTMFNVELPFADWAKEEGISDEILSERLTEAADASYAARVEKNGAELMRYIEKQVVLQSLDHLWREHLVTLDHLRQVIGWRGMAQRDPLNEYKSEAFDLFGELIKHLREQTTSQLTHIEVSFEQPEPPPLQSMQFEALHPAPEALTAMAQDFDREAGPAAYAGAPAAAPMAPVVMPKGERQADDPATWGKVGRNEACPCGSGKKYKHCHGAIS